MYSGHRLLPLYVAFLAAAVLPPGRALGAGYTMPLKRFSGCTSLFGDYRPGRYHAGLDFRTDGEAGWPVVAVADGYVLRASTSYYGYGRVLYLALDDGRVAVYGHLSEFGPQVSERVQAEQKRTHRYRTNVYFKENEVRVSRGMIIARSGQTGAGAPHLHFEIRTGDNKPLNPEWQGFPVADPRDPEIAALWIVPQYEDGQMGLGPGGADPVSIPLSGGVSTPLRPVGGKIFASGPVGLAVEAYDRKPNSPEHHNVSGLSLVVAGDTLFSARFDTLDYETMNQVRLERLTWLAPGGDLYALYKGRGNEMSHSRVFSRHPRGLLVVAPGDSALPFEIVVTDGNFNRRTVRGEIVYRRPESRPVDSSADAVIIHAHYLDLKPDRARGLAADLEARGLTSHLLTLGRPQDSCYRLHAVDVRDSTVWPELTEPLLSQTTLVALRPGLEHHLWLPDSSLEISIPGNAVYEPSFLEIRREGLPGGPPVIEVGPDDLVLRSPIRLSFSAPADTLAAVFSLSTTGKLSFVEGRRRAGRIECQAGGPSGFTFAVDSLPPVIRRLRPSEGAVVGRRFAVVAQLQDDLSGVGDDSLITVRVDGQWVPPEYDPETRQLVAQPFEPLAPGKHRFELEVSDWAGNTRRVSRSFRVK